MKNKYILQIVIVFTVLCLTGCYTSSKKPDPVPVWFSFAEQGSKTAKITFIQGDKVGVSLVDCEGVTRPAPVEGTYWERDNLYPVEKPLNIRVYVYWNENRYGERRRGIFKCPPLEAGKEYKLWFRGNLKGGALILTYSDVSGISYSSSGKLTVPIVYEQKIPPPPK